MFSTIVGCLVWLRLVGTSFIYLTGKFDSHGVYLLLGMVILFLFMDLLDRNSLSTELLDLSSGKGYWKWITWYLNINASVEYQKFKMESLAILKDLSEFP